MTLDPWTALAILGMALATFATRAGGFLLMRFITVRGRMRVALDALPAAILMAVIAPTVLTTGPAEVAAGAITTVAAMLRLPLIAVVVVGVVSVVVLRKLIS
ncbi:MAG: AzlD domain-containing protein [Pseudomonadota bacterium]|nr:AzlD domain-containing protein [Pseudomonadota bacterium]